LINISSNDIKDIGYIQEALACNITLEYLDISNNYIDDEGMKHLSEALTNNMVLTSFHFAQNKYKSNGLVEFLSILSSNDTINNLTFSIPEIEDKEEIEALRDLLITKLSEIKGTIQKLEILGKVSGLKGQSFNTLLLKIGC